jgi:recombination protein RecT
MSNTPSAQKPRFSVAIQTEGYQKLINNTLRDPKRAQRFIASISSAVAVNPGLQNCDAGTILAGALLGESLNLSPSPTLGQYYLVPFEDRKNNRTVATFILGYKGYIQLAIRSGQYKKLNVVAIKKGELVDYDSVLEEIEVKLIAGEIKRETAPTVGYYAMFEYNNGFRKTMYWSREKMEQHALRYSKGYAAKKGYTFWEKDFDSMAVKTMLRQLISKWGIMSIEMIRAIEADDHIINQNGTPDYITGGDIPALTSETYETVQEEVEAAEAQPGEVVDGGDGEELTLEAV